VFSRLLLIIGEEKKMKNIIVKAEGMNEEKKTK